MRGQPRTMSWVVLSRPYGTTRWPMRTQDYVLGYSQPSLRDLIRRGCFSRRHFGPYVNIEMNPALAAEEWSLLNCPRPAAGNSTFSAAYLAPEAFKLG